MERNFNSSSSNKLFSEAVKVIPGGVNSPVRAFKAVSGTPLFIESGNGAYITDVDGNKFIDYVTSFGPLILGHSHKEIVSSIIEAVKKGTSYGAPCPNEVKLAKLICEAIPSIEMVRMVNSGTEATMSAIRLARAYTGRNKIIKFEGCYHGHGDSFLVKAGSGMLTDNIPSSPGVPKSVIDDTLVCPYNDINSVIDCFNTYGNEIACVIVEPTPANMGLVLPKAGFLSDLRKITKDNGSLLIFDEVITGFRTGISGDQGFEGVFPDLTTLGKIIGGGLPAGAYGGRYDIMSMVAPMGSVYQAGTLSGNPLAVTAGCKMLEILMSNNNIYNELEKKASNLRDFIIKEARDISLPVCVNQKASMLTVFFTKEPYIETYSQVLSSDTNQYKIFHNTLLNNNVYFPPSQYEVAFLSYAHSDEDIEKTKSAIKKGLMAVYESMN